MSSTLSNINLFVRDIALSQQFYTDILGLDLNQEMSAPPHRVVFNAGGCTLSLQTAESLGETAAATEGIELGFEVANIAVAWDRVSRQAASVGEFQTMGWGSAFEVRDPDGHRLVVYQRNRRG